MIPSQPSKLAVILLASKPSSHFPTLPKKTRKMNVSFWERLFFEGIRSELGGEANNCRWGLLLEYKSPVPAKHLEDQGFGRNRREGNTTQAEGAKVN